MRPSAHALTRPKPRVAAKARLAASSMRKAGGVYMAVLRFRTTEDTERGMFERTCRGGVSGGSGEDHIGSNAKAARMGRRRRIRGQAILVMGAAYRRERRCGQGILRCSAGLRQEVP